MEGELRMRSDLKLINCSIEHFRILNSDHLMYITEYFDKIINEIDITAEKVIITKKLNVQEHQSNLTDQLNNIKSKCLNNFIMSNRSDQLTSQFSLTLESLYTHLQQIDSEKSTTNPTILKKFYQKVKKEILKSENKLLSGYYIQLKFIDESFNDFIKNPLGCQLLIRCSNNYKKGSTEDDLNEIDSELIYCFEAINNVTFSKTVLNTIYKLFTKTNDCEEAIKLLKLANSLSIPKPDLPSLNDINIDDNSNRSKNLTVLICLGILNGNYDVSRTSIRNILWNHFLNIFENYSCFEMNKHLYSFLRDYKIKFTKKQWETLKTLY